MPTGRHEGKMPLLEGFKIRVWRGGNVKSPKPKEKSEPMHTNLGQHGREPHLKGAKGTQASIGGRRVRRGQMVPPHGHLRFPNQVCQGEGRTRG